MSIEDITIELRGDDSEPLIVHNGLLADRQYKWTQELAAVTKKRNKTDEDHDEVARLEWRGSLYYDDDAGPYLPGNNVRRCLLDAARLTKEGKKIERGVIALSRINALQYDGPRQPEKMWEDQRFIHRAIVKVGTSKVVRTRPQFVGWAARVTLSFDSTIIERRDIVRIAQSAGSYIGIGDGRPFYGGRFTAKEA